MPTLNPTAFLADEPTLPEDKKDQQDLDQKDLDKDKQKKDKGLQWTELKKKKEEAEKKVEELQKKLDEIKGSETLKPIAEYLEGKYGKIDNDSVNKFIEHNKTRKKELIETREKLSQKDKELGEISIEKSDEFKNNYVIPFSKQKDSVLAVISPIDKSGKIKNPELITQLYNDITKVNKDGSPLSSIQIKGILSKFADEYEKKTGEEYDLPQLSLVVNEVADLVDKYKKILDAKNRWDEIKTEQEKEKLYLSSKKEEEVIKKEIANRDFIINKLKDEFDFSDIGSALEKDEILEKIDENHRYLTSILKREKDAKPRGYQSLIKSLAYADLFPILVEKYNNVLSELEKEKEKSKPPIPHGGSKRTEPKKAEEIVNPTEFLRN